MQVGDTVLHVNGTSPEVRRVHLDALTANSFSISDRADGFHTLWNGWDEIFDNETEANRAIIRNIDRAIEERQRQIEELVADRDVVLARLTCLLD
jgi:hypothetical protein